MNSLEFLEGGGDMGARMRAFAWAATPLGPASVWPQPLRTLVTVMRFTMVDRHGYPEETHFAFSYTPARDESGRVCGVFCACHETTARVRAARRLRCSSIWGDEAGESAET